MKINVLPSMCNHVRTFQTVKYISLSLNMYQTRGGLNNNITLKICGTLIQSQFDWQSMSDDFDV